MNKNIENVLTTLDGFRTNGKMTYSAYSTLHDEISLLDDLLKELEAERVEFIDSDGGKTHWYVCGGCKSIINQGDGYCHECGKALKWKRLNC